MLDYHIVSVFVNYRFLKWKNFFKEL
jgi:hypothetical protein